MDAGDATPPRKTPAIACQNLPSPIFRILYQAKHGSGAAPPGVPGGRGVSPRSALGMQGYRAASSIAAGHNPAFVLPYRLRTAGEVEDGCGGSARSAAPLFGALAVLSGAGPLSTVIGWFPLRPAGY